MPHKMELLGKPALRDDPLLDRVWERLGRPLGCLVTGGYLRDRLLGRPSRDLDLAFEGGADEAAEPARRLAETAGTRAHLLGTAPHRIWRVEIASFKVELWPMGGLTREEDARRRDFTCNALSWELPDGPLIDHVGGIEDIGRLRLRAISRDNLVDDPVRLLRAPRFLAQLPDFELDDRTRGWIRELAPSLTGAPRERVGQELLTLLQAPAASRGLRECLALGLFGPAAPIGAEIDESWLVKNFHAADALTGQRGGVGLSAARERLVQAGDAGRLAFLFRAWGVPTGGRLASYAWSQTDRENALRAARFLDQARTTVNASPADRRELAWRSGASFPALIALAAALDPGQPGWRRWWRQWLRNPDALARPRPLLSGTEIAELAGIEPGPELGAAIHALLRAQVRGEVRTTAGAVIWLSHHR